MNRARSSEFSHLLLMALVAALGLGACGIPEKDFPEPKQISLEDKEDFPRGPMVKGGSPQDKEASRLYDEAEDALLVDGNADRAIPLYKKALATDGGKSIYSSRLAEILLKRHLVSKARNLYLDTYKNSSFDSLTLVKLGEIATICNKYGEAYKYYLMALAIKPNSKEAWHGLKEVAPEVGKQRLAIDIDELGSNRDGYRGLSFINELIEEQVKLNPDDLDYLVSLANCEIIGFQFDKANKTLDRALALKADDPRVLILKGQQLHFHNHVPEARAMLKRCIEISPFQAYAWANLGNLEWKEKNIPEALHYLERACNIENSHPDWAAQLAQLVKERDQQDLKKAEM